MIPESKQCKYRSGASGRSAPRVMGRSVRQRPSVIRVRAGIPVAIALLGALTCSGQNQMPPRGTIDPNTPEYYAWWLRVRFEPIGDRVLGVPIGRIDSTWDLASVLTGDMMPLEATRQSLPDSVRRFEIDADFDGDGDKERAVVGVYRDRVGNAGRFVLILTRRGRSWESAAVFTQPGEAGFSILTAATQGVAWLTCLECDSWVTIEWSAGEYVQRSHSCCDPELDGSRR